MTSTRKRILWWGAGLLGVAAAAFVGLVFWLGAEGPVSPAGFARLREGMTAAAVEAVLGPPPSRREMLSGEAGSFSIVARWGEGLELPRNSVWPCWEGELYTVEVAFDE